MITFLFQIYNIYQLSLVYAVWFIIIGTINHKLMLKLILSRNFQLMAGFKVQKFTPKDFETMCALIKQKHPIYNEAIVINRDVKLIDEKGKFIGRYSASEARKKATNVRKDIVLVNATSNPAVCRLANFRQDTLKRFYDQIVNKRNQNIIKKASSSKQLKISGNLNQNEMQIKSKQLVELAKKNLNVRVFGIYKYSQKQQGLSKFDYIKSLVSNRCTIEKDISVADYVEEEQGFEERRKKQENKVVISFTVKSKQNQFMDLLKETSVSDQDKAIQIFLNRYYRQQDVQMKDLKQNQVRVTQFSDFFNVDQAEQKKVEKKKQQKVKEENQSSDSYTQQFISDKELQRRHKQMNLKYSLIEKEAKARILNQRLKRILQITQ